MTTFARPVSEYCWPNLPFLTRSTIKLPLLTSLSLRRTEHDRRTAEIVRLETQFNARVYALFDLTPEEIKLIEESTKYRYGEV